MKEPSKEERKRLLIEMLNDKSDELDREAKSHQVTNTEQLLVNAGASKKEYEKNGMYEGQSITTQDIIALKESFGDPSIPTICVIENSVLPDDMMVVSSKIFSMIKSNTKV